MKGRKPGAIVASTSTLGDVPKAPAWLSVEARAEWRRIMPALTERRVLTTPDLGMAEAFCVALGRVRQLERIIQKAGDDLDLALVRAQDKATMTARQLAAELGLTPVSRSRPTIRGDDAEEETPFT